MKYIMMLIMGVIMMFSPMLYAAETTQPVQNVEQSYSEKAEYYGLIVSKVMESFTNSLINIASKLGMAANDLIFSPLGIMLLIYLFFKFTFVKIFGFGLFLIGCYSVKHLFQKQKLNLVSYDTKSYLFGLIKFKTNCVYQKEYLNYFDGDHYGEAVARCFGTIIVLGTAMLMMFT